MDIRKVKGQLTLRSCGQVYTGGVDQNVYCSGGTSPGGGGGGGALG